MDRLRRGNRNLIKDLNKALVIDQVRRFGPISRKEIADNTSLGASTVTYIVDGLIKENFVREIGSGISNGGRKPVLLEFNGQQSFVIAIKIEQENLIFARLDLNANILEKKMITFPIRSEPKFIQDLIEYQVKEWVVGNPDMPCAGVGIAVSGIVNQNEKTVLYSPFLEWEGVSFKDLEERINFPIFLDNDANAFALAELWNRENFYENYICITIGAGIGAGIVLKNEIYRGENGGAGEFGHITISYDGIPCYCGQRGCLEAYTSDQFVIDEVKRLHSLKLTAFFDHEEDITSKSIVKAAENGDVHVLDIYKRVGRVLGIGIKNLINVLNPGAIILGGEGLRAKDYILPALHEELSNYCFSQHVPRINVLLTDLNQDKWLIGIGSLVINELFKEPLYRDS